MDVVRACTETKKGGWMLERSNPPNTSFNKSYKAKWSKIGEESIIAEKNMLGFGLQRKWNLLKWPVGEISFKNQ